MLKSDLGRLGAFAMLADRSVEVRDPSNHNGGNYTAVKSLGVLRGLLWFRSVLTSLFSNTSVVLCTNQMSTLSRSGTIVPWVLNLLLPVLVMASNYSHNSHRRPNADFLGPLLW